MLGNGDDGADFALLDAAFDLGYTTFDCGHNYNDGASERIVGRWLEARGLRDSVIILDKGGHHNEDRRRVTTFDLASDLHDSLARLRTDRIDLYVLHRDDEGVPVGPLIEALNAHRAAGRIGAYGASNWSHQRLAEANAYALDHGLEPFTVSSPNLSLARQIAPPWKGCISISDDDAADAWYRANEVAVIPWSSLAGGFMSGRFRRDNLADFDGYFEQLAVATYADEINFGCLDRAERLAAERGASVAQIALAWVLHRPYPVYPLVGSRNEAELAANAAAVAIDLSDAELTWLETGEGKS
jgi:aryl-alcohol dehydrogenase-like predicted oxidoreductase